MKKKKKKGEKKKRKMGNLFSFGIILELMIALEI